MKNFWFVLILSAAAFGQVEISASPRVAACAVPGPVTVDFSYALPQGDAVVDLALTDPAAAPAHIVWYWGDDPSKDKPSFSEGDFKSGQKMSHAYARPGKYSVAVVISDTKNRSVRQTGVLIKINQPVEIVTP